MAGPVEAGRVPAVAARAVLCAVLAVVVTFSRDRSPAFGLVVLGVFLVLQAGVLAAGTRATAATRLGRRLVLVRAAVSLVAGVTALVLSADGLGVLRPLEASAFLVLGALEIVGGVRRAEAAETTGDAIVVGGLQVLVAAMLVILDADAVFVVGILGAWGAVVAVYLGIAAVSLARRTRRP